VDYVGTSWSSLQVLRKFAIEIVKIDRAFINNLEADEGMNRAIVEAIIHVGHSLAMSTVAEGVESSQQAAILREFGADVGQGYFFAPPLREEEAHELATAEPRPIFSLGPGRESSAAASRVQRTVAVHVAPGQNGGTAQSGVLGGPSPSSSPSVASPETSPSQPDRARSEIPSSVSNGSGHDTGNTAHNSGYDSGYSSGYSDGQNAAQNAAQKAAAQKETPSGARPETGGSIAADLELPVAAANGSSNGFINGSASGSGSNSILGSGSISGPEELETDEPQPRQPSGDSRDSSGEVA
jgi:hypothetical protein